MFHRFDANSVPSPAYVIDLDCLEANARTLASIRHRTGTNILLALKGFAAFATFPLLRDLLDGVCASGLYEARLGAEEFRKQVHTYSPAFRENDVEPILGFSDHISFNSLSEWKRYAKRAQQRNVSCGMRINPQCSKAPTAIYDPCAIGSRFGMGPETVAQLMGLDDIDGIALHALCEEDSHALEFVVDAVTNAFSPLLHRVQWLNLGGGHMITQPDYDIDHLCDILAKLRSEFELQLFIEPGEAVAFEAGVLVATVLDIVQNDGDIAILDTSATTHMPDILEMPYTPSVVGAKIGAKPSGHTYRLAGTSCLAGDVIGEYTFEDPLLPGQRILFSDMAHYTMVKNNHFNGVPLPAIATWSPSQNEVRVIREFGFKDYSSRLS